MSEGLSAASRLLKNCPVAAFICEHERKAFVDVNLAACDLYGFSTEQFLSMTLADISVTDSNFQANCGGDRCTNVRHRKRNGEEIFADLTFWAIEDDHRSLTCVMVYDVSELHAAREKLRYQESLLRNITDHLPGSTVFQQHIKDNKKTLKYLTSGIEPLTGFTLEDIFDNVNLLADAMHKDDVAAFQRARQHAIDNLSNFEFTYRHRLPDQTYRWLHVRAKASRDEEGGIVLDGMLHDITEQRNLQTHLFDYANKLMLAAKVARFGVWEWDLLTNQIAGDHTMYSLFSLKPNGATVSFEDFTRSIVPEDLQAGQHELSACLQEKRQIDIMFRIITPMGQTRFIRMIGEPQFEGDLPVRMLGASYDFTDTKHAEAQIRESETRFQFLADSAPILIWKTNQKHETIFLSKGWYEFTGKTPEQELGYGWVNSIHPDDRENMLAVFHDACNNLQNFRAEYRLLRHDGEYRWILDTGVVRLYESGEFQGFVGSCVDITDRKAAEKTLQDSEARYRSIIDDQNEMICRFASDGNLTFVNKAFTRTYQVQHPIQLQTFDSVVKGCVDDYRALASKGGSTEFRAILPTSEYQWQEWQFIQIKNQNEGESEIQAIGRNIQYRKVLEQEQKRLSQIVKDTYNEIYLVDTDSLHLIYVNNSGLKNLGYSEVESAQLRLPDLFNYPDEFALRPILRSLKTTEHSKLQLQLRHRRKDGSFYEVNSLFQLLENEHMLVVIASDVTGENITKRNLLAALDEKDTLIKEMHHRVKNNLQLISSLLYVKMLCIGEPDMKSFLQDMRSKIKSIGFIHERLLQTESLGHIDISFYLEKLLADIEGTYVSIDCPVLLRRKLNPVLVGIDTAIFCGLLVNELVTNAVKYAFKDRTNGIVEVSFVVGDQKQCILTVRNNGIPLPENITPSVTGSYGMQLVHLFIKQLAGRLDISRDGGTSFEITFPHLNR